MPDAELKAVALVERDRLDRAEEQALAILARDSDFSVAIWSSGFLRGHTTHSVLLE